MGTIFSVSESTGAVNITGPVTVNSNQIHLVTDPTSAQDAATKNYVDSIAQGITWKQVAQAATTTILPNSPTYSNGSSGVGATLTATTNGALTVDGYTVLLNDRVLIKNQASGFQNGIYTQTTLGTGSVPYVLTRATDSNTPTDLEAGTAVFVVNGTVNVDTAWVQTTTGTITIGTTSLSYTQFSGLSGTISSGTAGNLATYTGSTTIGSIAANTSANNFKITNLAVPTTTGDALSYGNVLNGSSLTLSTPLSTGNGGTGLSSIGSSSTELRVNSSGALYYAPNVVNVKDYGAVGNGSTDDTTAIQNALASGAGTVFFPDGTYIIDGSTSPTSVTVTTAGQTILLTGGATLKAKTNPTGAGAVFQIGANNVKFIGGTIDGNATNRPSLLTALYIGDINDFIIQNTIIQNSVNYGILSEASLYAKIQNCQFYNTNGGAINFRNPTATVLGTVIADNIIDMTANNTASTQAAIAIGGTSSFHFQNTLIRGNQVYMVHSPTSGNAECLVLNFCDYFTIDQNVMDGGITTYDFDNYTKSVISNAIITNSGGYGIIFNGNDHVITNCLINTTADGGDGINIGGNNVLVSNVRILNPSNNGITINGALNNIVVSGVVVDGLGGGKVAFSAGAATVYTALGIISNGVEQNNIIAGDLVFTSTSSYGIQGSLTNDSAAAGNVGEYVSSTASATNYTSNGINQSFASITLSAGDWQIFAQSDVSLAGSTVTSGPTLTINTSVADGTFGDNTIAVVPPTSSSDTSGSLSVRASISTSTTYDLISRIGFSAGHPQFAGKIWARRMR